MRIQDVYCKQKEQGKMRTIIITALLVTAMWPSGFTMNENMNATQKFRREYRESAPNLPEHGRKRKSIKEKKNKPVGRTQQFESEGDPYETRSQIDLVGRILRRHSFG